MGATPLPSFSSSLHGEEEAHRTPASIALCILTLQCGQPLHDQSPGFLLPYQYGLLPLTLQAKLTAPSLLFLSLPFPVFCLSNERSNAS